MSTRWIVTTRGGAVVDYGYDFMTVHVSGALRFWDHDGTEEWLAPGGWARVIKEVENA